MKLYLKTLSPVHIGSGEFCDSLSPYFTTDTIDGKNIKKCYFININNIFKSWNENDISLFSQWMNDIALQIDKEKDNKNISNIRKEWSIDHFLVNKKKLTKDQCKKLLTQKENYYYAATVRSDINSPRNIVRHVITPDCRPYIPGSSIKGAIRTAMCVKMLNSMDSNNRKNLLERISDTIKINDKSKDIKISIDKAEDILMKALFCYGKEDKWQHFDFCKFLSIADCFTNQQNIDLYQVPVLTKVMKNNTSSLRFQQINLFETIPAGTNMVFLLNFDFKKMKCEYTNYLVNNNEDDSKIKFCEKFERIFTLLFDIPFKEIMNKSEKEFHLFAFEKLKSIIDKHSRIVIDEDKKWFQQFPETKSLIYKLDGISKHNGLLRLGYASGFLSDTIFAIAKKGDETAQNLYKKIFQATALDLPPNMKINNRGRERSISKNIFNSFPSSRRVITGSEDGGILPLGWVKINNSK